VKRMLAQLVVLPSNFTSVGSIDSDTSVVGQIMGYVLLAERIFPASSGPRISPDEDRVSRPDQTTTSRIVN